MATWVGCIGYVLAFILAVLWGREIRARLKERSQLNYAENAAATLETAANSLSQALAVEREISNDWRLRVVALRETMLHCDPSVAGDFIADALTKLLADKTGDPSGGSAHN